MTFDAEMHHQYMASHWSPRKDCVDIFINTMNAQTEVFQTQYNARIETVKYGDLGPRQEMDIVFPKDVQENTPIFVFIHGGYWNETTREMHLCAIKPAVERGYIAANVGYDQAPHVSLKTIVDEIRESYIYLCKRFPKSCGMIVQGHSAGGHLVCMLLSTDWEVSYNLTRKIPIVQLVPISGVYDLRPIVHVDVGADLKLTAEDIQQLSPLLQTDTALKNILEFQTKVTSFVAQHDPPVFKDKGLEYVEELRNGGAIVEQIEVINFDHFDIISRLIDQNHPINQTIFSTKEEI